MAREPNTQLEVLRAVVELLLDEIDDLTRSTCVVSHYPQIPPGSSNNVFVTVTPMEGSFEPQDHQSAIIENSGVVVTVWSAIKGRAGRGEQELMDETRGVLDWKRRILRVLSLRDLSVEGNTPLAALMFPLSSGRPEVDFDSGRVSLMMSFSTDIWWDIAS